MATLTITEDLLCHRERQRLATARWRAKYPGRSQAQSRASYLKNKDRNKARVAANGVKWRREHPERKRKHNRDCFHRVRRAALVVLGEKCKRCGFSDVRALQIDHVNGGGNQEYKLLGSRYNIWKRVISGIPGYQLLCANCNWIKKDECGEKTRRAS